MAKVKKKYIDTSEWAMAVERAWALQGEIKVPSGDTDFIPPIFLYVPANQTFTLKFVQYGINGGTSATFKVKQKTVSAGSYTDVATGIVADTTPNGNKTDFSSNNSLAGGSTGTMFMVAIEVTSVSGTPKNLSVTLNYEKPVAI